MGTTGVIFGAIVIAWLAYLVPHFARRRDDEHVESDPSRFTESARIVRHGSAPLVDQDLQPIGSYEVSTPLTRRAAIGDLRRLEALAASRRRRVLVVLMLLLSAAVALAALGWVGWAWLALPGGLLLAFGTVARVSVRAMRRSLDARYAAIGAAGDERTVLLNRAEVGRVAKTPAADDAPRKVPGALWDAVPITVPTYVQKPLAPRTVRTIDLSGPGVAPAAQQTGPVTADALETPAPAARDERDGRDGRDGRDEGEGSAAASA